MSLGDQLIEAVATRDASALAACFSPDLEFRALVPSGLRERHGASETAQLFTKWFADSTELDLVESRVDEVGGRLYVVYRLTGVEDDEPYLVEQHLYGTVVDGKISKADLLCSGFRPRSTD